MMLSSSLKFPRETESKTQKKWWLFHATDFESLMYPSLTSCRILGTFPYKINASTLEASKLRYILSTVIVCVSCVFNLTFIYNIDISKSFNFGHVTRNFAALTFYTFTGFTVIITHVLSGPRMRLLRTIMEISSRLPPESYKKLSRLIHAKDIFGSFYLIGLILIYFYTSVVHIIDIIYIIFSAHTHLHMFVMDMLYMNCVCIIKACFKEINNNLLHMQEFIVNNKLRVSMMFYYKQRNAFLIMNLKALKKQHLMISDAVNMLNIIFSVQLLATIIITYSQFIFGFYSYLQWYDSLFKYFDKKLDMIFLITAFIIKMVLLVWACETGKNQAQEIRTTIHDVLNISRNEQIKNELQLFSLQTWHCKNTFSAKGLNVDASFLATMAGTTATYMLILLQFWMMSHSCDGKSAINSTRIM
ncbi:uncharacterized protein LOC143896304 [Temnothorax americanus]|uniref:uncharacterized protein LOC143896304 n=1 Tax=Temnothorax americanus TaxID=1964332 RepID=UPI004068192A